jgi:hypothetical protein
MDTLTPTTEQFLIQHAVDHKLYRESHAVLRDIDYIGNDLFLEIDYSNDASFFDTWSSVI